MGFSRAFLGGLVLALLILVVTPAFAQEPFIRGDCNNDGIVNIADASFILNLLFQVGPPGACFDACDANADGIIDLADAVFIQSYRLLAGSPPPPPFPVCGTGLDCAGPTTCIGDGSFSPAFKIVVGDGVTVGGAPATVDVTMSNPASVQAFVVAVCIDETHITITDVGIGGTITEAVGAEVVVSEIFIGGFTLAVILDASPPFLGQIIPVGSDLKIANFEATPVAVGNVVSALELCDGILNSPPLDNILVVAGFSFNPELINGTFTCVAPVECVPVDPDVRTQGFWKRVCERPHPSGEHENLPDYVDFVNDFATFGNVVDVDDLCDQLHPDPPSDKCEKAEAQFMALLLNLASGRVEVCNCVQDPELGNTTVGEVADFIDGVLSDPGPTFQDCVVSQAIADRINNGDTLVDCP